MRSRLSAALVAAFMAFGLLSLSVGGYAFASHPAKSKSVTVQITEKNNKFSLKPDKVTIKKGVTVVWVNKTKTEHYIAANDMSWRTSLIQPHKKGHHTFTKKGTYKYHDVIISTLKGQVKVK